MDFSTSGIAFEAADDAEDWNGQGIEAEPAATKSPGYEQCKLPHAVVDDTRLGLAALFLLSYRVRQSPGWGTNRNELARDFGFGERNFYKAVKELTEAGYMKRTTTKRGGSNGLVGLKWFAREEITLGEARGREGYQLLPRAIREKRWKETPLLDYVNSRPFGFAVTPEKIAHRFNIHVKTVRHLMAPLVAGGWIKEGEIEGVDGYIRQKRRAASVPLPEKPDTAKPEVVNTKTGQNAGIVAGQNVDTETGQNVDTPYRNGQCYFTPAHAEGMDIVLARAPGTGTVQIPANSAVACSKSSASATFREGGAGKRADSTKAKPKAKGKKAARKEATSTKPKREWIAILDAEGRDVIERIQRNDRSQILHPMLFRYEALQELAELLDAAERDATERYGFSFGLHARDTAVHAIIGKLCGWCTSAEAEPGDIRTWDYFTDAIWEEIQLAMREARNAA